jgi:hypothetical protein
MNILMNFLEYLKIKLFGVEIIFELFRENQVDADGYFGIK